MNIKPTFFFIYIAVFINIVSFTMVFPLLPAYAREFNASDLQIGLMASSFALAQLLFSALWGSLSDRMGRKPIIAMGLLGMGAGFIVFGMAWNITILFVSRFLQGMFSAATLPASRAYIADVTTPEERLKAMGHLGAAIALGIILGPAIGGILSQGGLALPFFVSAAVAFVNFLLVILFLPESIKQKSKKAIDLTKTFLGNFAHIYRGLKGSLAALFILAFVWSFAFSNNSISVPLLGMEKFNLSVISIGMLFTVMGLISAMTQIFLLTKITSFLGERSTALIGLAMMALGFVSMPFLPSQIIFLYIAIAVAGLGSALSRPVITALISKETPDEQGKTMGVANAFESLGRLIGPLMGGFLFSFGIELPFLFSGAVIVLVLALVIKKARFLENTP